MICYTTSLINNKCICNYIICIKCIKEINVYTCINCKEELNINIFKILHKDTNIYKKYFINKSLLNFKNNLNLIPSISILPNVFNFMGIDLNYLNYTNKKNNLHIYINSSNLYSKYYKKRIKYEYLYFTQINNDKLIDKLYNIYITLDYCHIIYNIVNKNFNISQKSIIDYLSYNKIFYPKHLLYINKTLPPYFKELYNIVEYKNEYINYNINYDINDIYNILKINKIYITNYCCKEKILQTCTDLTIKSLVIISTKLSINIWKKILNNYNFKVIFIPIHKIKNISQDNKAFIYLEQDIYILNNNFKEFIKNAAIIIENKYMVYNKILKVIEIIVNYALYNNIYIINIHNNYDIFSNIFIKYYTESYPAKLVSLFCSNISKKKFIDIFTNYYKKNNIIYPTKPNKEVLYNKNFRYIHYMTFYGNNMFVNSLDDFTQYALLDVPYYTIYQIKNKFYMFNKEEEFLIIQDHQFCDAYCYYCRSCLKKKFNNIYVIEEVDIELIKNCCKTHKLPYLSKYSKNYNIECILNKFKQFNFSIPEINIIFYKGVKMFLKILCQYKLNLYENSNNNDMSLDIYDLKFNKNKIKTTNYIIEYPSPIYMHIGERYINEYNILDKLVKYLMLHKNSILNKKYIVILEFNDNIRYLKIKYPLYPILYIYKKTSNNNKCNILNKFAHSDLYNILVISKNSELPDCFIDDKFMIHILSLNNKYINVNSLLNIINITRTYKIKFYMIH